MKVLDYTLPKLVIGFLIGLFCGQYIILDSLGQIILYAGLAALAIGCGVGVGILVKENRLPNNTWVWQLRIVGSVVGGFLLGIIAMSFF